MSNCPFGLVVARTTVERDVLGSVPRSGKKCYWVITKVLQTRHTSKTVAYLKSLNFL